jgi:hypothetical protein
MDALLGSLTETELALVREVDPDRLAGLTEDDLIELHKRVRRARNKHVKLYRRSAAALVGEVGGRGKARPKNTRNRAKAEVFEQALAAVSRQLAAKAQESADELQTERLNESKSPVVPRVPRLKSQLTDRKPDSPALRRRQASTRAKGARRQARRDSK